MGTPLGAPLDPLFGKPLEVLATRDPLGNGAPYTDAREPYAADTDSCGPERPWWP